MKLGIGTAQFGMDYGITNSCGKISIAEVRKVLDLAKENGVRFLDTAWSYGCSESVLGQILGDDASFSIITKTPVLRKKLVVQQDVEKLLNGFYQSLERLRQAGTYGLLVHMVDDLLVPGGELLWEALENLRNTGLVKKIGVSVYDTKQIGIVLEKYKIDIIQIPINVFDQKLLLNGCLKRLKACGIEIHARSVFLQGVLLARLGELPKKFAELYPHLRHYYEFVYKHKWNPIQAALGFVAGIEHIDCAIVGVDGYRQLREIIDNYIELDPRIFASVVSSSCLLNPTNWRM